MKRPAGTCLNGFRKKKIEQSQEEDGPMGRSRGHLAKAVNGITSGTLLVGLLSTVNSVIGSSNVTFAILAIFAALLILSTWFFFCNIYIVVAAEYFLECAVMKAFPLTDFYFLIRVKKWIKVSATMFVEFFLFMSLESYHYWRNHKSVFLLYGSLYYCGKPPISLPIRPLLYREG